MKRTLLMTTLVAFGLSHSAWAGACPSGDTLADYIALPSTGCTIGDITFSNFGYAPSGSILIPAADVHVSPQMGAESGFQFNAPWFAFPNPTVPNILDAFISFTATCDANCKIDDWVLKIGGTNAPGDSAVNVSESANELKTSLAAGSLGGVTTSSDFGTFPPVGSLTVSKDIIVYGGTHTPGGLFAQVSSVTNLFSTTETTMTPEPSLLIFCAGFVCLLPVVRRKLGRV
jgi:hypothetical protein